MDIVPSPTPNPADVLKRLLKKKEFIIRETYFRKNQSKDHDDYDDSSISDLNDDLSQTDEAISNEIENFPGPVVNPELNPMVSIGVFANFEGKIHIALIYGASFFLSYLSIVIDMRGKNM
jgi:hypothetical protein